MWIVQVVECEFEDYQNVCLVLVGVEEYVGVGILFVGSILDMFGRVVF